MILHNTTALGIAAALAAVLALSTVACGDDSSAQTQYAAPVLKGMPPADIANPLHTATLPLLIVNSDNSRPVRLRKFTFVTAEGETMAKETIDGRTWFRWSNGEASYLLRLRVMTERMAFVAGAPTTTPAERLATFVPAAGDAGLCDASGQPLDVVGPAWCDVALLTSWLDQKLITAPTSIDLVPASQAKLSPFAMDLGENGYVGWARDRMVHVCGLEGDLAPGQVRRIDPDDETDLFESDGATLDEKKLASLCNVFGSLKTDKLTLSTSDAVMATLPVAVMAKAELTGASGVVPSQGFTIGVVYQGDDNQEHVASYPVRFLEFRDGNPVAVMNLSAASFTATRSALADSAESFSPYGDARKPLHFMWTIAAAATGTPPAYLLPTGKDQKPETGVSLLGTWTTTQIFNAWFPLEGSYTLTLTAKDTLGLLSEPAQRTINVVSPQLLHVALWWDRQDADLELALIRHRGPYSSYRVPKVQDDMVNNPQTISCKTDLDCSIVINKVTHTYFCSQLPGSNDKFCTYHPDDAHYDTCYSAVPNPQWGESYSEDDDPELVAQWPAPGPQAITIPFPAATQGRLRVLVRLMASSSASLSKADPVKATVRIRGKNTATTTTVPLYFRSGGDIPVWKVADILWSEYEEPTITWMPLNSPDCYVPGTCPFANPLNAVIDKPFDPLDETTPRSIWCDSEGDSHCIVQ